MSDFNSASNDVEHVNVTIHHRGVIGNDAAARAAVVIEQAFNRHFNMKQAENAQLKSSVRIVVVNEREEISPTIDDYRRIISNGDVVDPRPLNVTITLL